MISKSMRMFYKLSAVLLLAGGFSFMAIPAVEVQAEWCTTPGGVNAPFYNDGPCEDFGGTEVSPPAAGPVTFTIACQPGASFSTGSTGAVTEFSTAPFSCFPPPGEGDQYAPNVQVGANVNLNGFGVIYEYSYQCVGSTTAPSGANAANGYIVSCPDGPGAVGLDQLSSRPLTTTLQPTPQGDCPSGYYLAGDDCLRGTAPIEGDGDPSEAGAGCNGSTGGTFNPSCPGDIPDAGRTVIGCTDVSVVGPEGVAPGTLESPILCQFIRIVRFLTIGVSVVAAITVAITGLQYTMSRGDPSKTSQAVQRLAKVGAGIVLYLFGWALLEFLIPGGPV